MKEWLSVLLTGILVLIGYRPCLQAQPPTLLFDHLSVKDGLPSSDVYSIASDRQGFMWFGTRRCPVRYDGENFQPILFPETNVVTGMVADSVNRMWVATERQGVASIDPKTKRLTQLPGTRGHTSYLFFDSAGNGWFSDETGANCIDHRTRKVRHYPFRQTSFRGAKIHGFLEDKQHTLWALGSDNGLFRFDSCQDRFICVLGLDCPMPSRRFQCYLSRGCVDADGILWVGTFGKGLLRLDPKTEKYTFLKTPERQNWVTCVEEGKDENGSRLLWLGDTQGLLVFRPVQHRFFRVPNVLPTPFYVHALYRHPSTGILWVGTSEGVLKYNPQDNLIRTVRLPSDLVRQPVQVNVITADLQDTTGQTFWLGLSHTGLLRWHRATNSFTLVRYPSARAETMWILQPDNRQLWIGLRRWDYTGDGVLVYDTRLNQFVDSPAAKRAGKLFSVPFVDHGLIDKHNRLWIGNNDEGLRVLDIRTGQQLRYWPDSVIKALHRNNNFLTDIKIDRNERIWLGTYQGPYYLADSTYRFVRADDQNPKSRLIGDVETNNLLIGRNGHVWAARWGSVTESSPDGKQLTVLTARNGLYDRENQRLSEDGEGIIWIGNFEGLHVYNPRTRQLLRFTVSDGLSRNNTTACLYVHQGKMLYIGQENGLNYLDVSVLHRRLPMPNVVISSVRVHEQERPYDLKHALQLTHDDNAFSVDFVAMTYSRLPSTHYAYFLEGFDKRWNHSGLAHRAYYTNLSPGHYILHVKAADTLDNWSREPVQFSIDVLPAYYETWWFRGLILLIVVGLLYALYRYRVNQLLGVQRIRNRISADLHDEIGSSLSGIGILGTMIKKNLPAEHPSGSMVERIVSESRQVSSSLDDIVWSINPHNDALSSLIARMNRYAAELFEASGIQYEVDVPDTIQHLTLPMEKRQDFYLFVKEAVNNIVKHASATHARLIIRREHKHLHLTITDNGVGFDPSAETTRNGLRNMRMRAQHLHGQLSIESIAGQGTTLNLLFPLLT